MSSLHVDADLADGRSQAGAESEVPFASPRVVPVENVLVTPKAGGEVSPPAPSTTADFGAIEAASSHARSLARLNGQASAALTATEQDSVHHSLYKSNAAPVAHGAPAVSRLCVSVRANDLLSPSWVSEATSLVALFALDTTSGSSGQYQLLAQTELVPDTNTPIFKTQFVLQRGGRNRNQTYMLRVYDVESEVIDEADYVGLATFNVEEILQNCRGAQGGGGFVSVVLPLTNPANATWNDQLQTAHASITLSLQIPVESGAPRPAVSQATHQYTRMVNQIAPHIQSTNMDLNLAIEGSASTTANLLSVWYRLRPTAQYQFLSSLNASRTSPTQHTLVVSNELFLLECADAADLDECEAGFEVKVVAHDRSKLPQHALTTARNTERALGSAVHAAITKAEEDEVTKAGLKDAALVGSATITFKALLLALDQPALNLPLTDAPNTSIKLSLKSRPGLVEVDESVADEAVASPAGVEVPSIPSSIPSSVLAKAHDLLRAGLYFTEHLLGSQTRDVFVRLIDGVEEGQGKPTRLSWKAADAASDDEGQSMALSTVTHVYGGSDSSPAFAARTAAGHALPLNDSLFTICSSSTESLSLEAPSWSVRDTFIFSILSFQAQVGLDVAVWHPSEVVAARAPRIVATERPTITAVKPTLGGSHGSLARTRKVPAASTPASPTPAATDAAAAAAAAVPASPNGVAATPASPSSPSPPSDVDLSSVLGKLEKLFEQGRNFIRYTAGSHKPHYISLFLRKDVRPADADPNAPFRPLFCLYWCRADQRTVSETRALRCEEILGVALGKQTAVFLKNESSLAPASHCFSIIAGGRSLHLQSWNERDSDTYAFGIASLCKHYGPKPRLWQAGQYSESSSRLEIENASELREASDGTRQVDGHEIPALANAQGFKCAIELAIKCRNLPSKHSNHIVCVFDRDEETEKLTYIAQTEKQARGINPEFKKAFKLTYDSSTTRKLRFNLYDLDATKKQMDDEDRMGAAMLLLREVVDGAGIEFVYKLTHENPIKQAALVKAGATIVITCTSKSEATMDLTKR